MSTILVNFVAVVIFVKVVAAAAAAVAIDVVVFVDVAAPATAVVASETSVRVQCSTILKLKNWLACTWVMCDQRAKWFFQYLATCNNTNLPNSIIN